MSEGESIDTGPGEADFARLLALVARQATAEGRTDSLYPGLRFYRFSHPIRYRKMQLLMPGIVVVLQGRKTALLGRRSLSYDASHYLVLGGETACDGTIVEASEQAPYLALHLDLPPEFLVKTILALADPQAAEAQVQVRETFVSPIDPNIIAAFTRLLPATDDAMDCRLIAPLIVEEIVVRLLRSEAAAAIRDAAQVTRTAARIQTVMQFMREHFSQHFTIDQLAARIAMSPSHFAHSFRAIAGVSPMRYLRDVRLDAARALLLGGGMRVAEAAEKTGFESAAHFTREFKNRFDASPAAYVRRMLARRTSEPPGEFRRIDQ